MKSFFSTAAAFGLTIAVLLAPKLSLADEPRLLQWDAGQLAQARRQIAEGEPAVSRVWKQLQREAEQALALTPPSVMTKPQAPPSGDKHDYLSFGPYWWPDPATKDGLPYIRRDGEVNPESRGPTSDWQSLETMTDAVETLSLAYYSTMNAQGLLTLATYGKRLGVDLWGHRGPRGQSIPAAVQFLIRFADPNVEWTFQQITPVDRAAELQPLLAQAVVVFGSPDAAVALPALAVPEESHSVARLLWPSAWGGG